MFSKHQIAVVSVLFVTNLFLVFAGQAFYGELRVHFLDVAQGDAILIETPAGRQVLIDGGPDNSVVQKLSETMPFWDRSIDLVMLTHHDADHLTGLIEVLKRYEVKAIIETGIECEKADCLAWRQAKEKEGAFNFAAEMGQEILLDRHSKIIVLYPFENLIGEKVSKPNNASMVVKLVFGEHEILLTGDIEKQVEEKLVLTGVNLDSDYLKVPHHGSKTSSSDQFLDAVSPAAAFISLGLDNRYGHPHKEVTDRLEKRNIKYYRTDTDGDIVLICELRRACQIEKN